MADEIGRRELRFANNGAFLSDRVEITGKDGGRLENVRRATITLEGGEITKAEIELIAPAFDLVAETKVHDAIWADFRSWEQGAAERGSGLTQEQMTGATLFWVWLKEHAEKKPS